MVAALLRCHHRLDTVIQCVCAAPVGLPACLLSLLSVVLLRYLRSTLQHFTAFNSNPFDTRWQVLNGKMLNFHSNTVYVRQRLVWWWSWRRSAKLSDILWICCRLLAMRLDIVHMSYYVTLCHTMSHWRSLIQFIQFLQFIHFQHLPATFIQLWHCPSLWFPGWTSCCVGWWSAVVDRFVAAVTWRARRAPISWLIHGYSCRSVLHSPLLLYYNILYIISIYIIQIHTDRFLECGITSFNLDLNSDSCQISPVQVQSAAISWRPVRTLGQDA